ncbi:amidohydrolase [Limobrevibacterium gyesilva]|uniref:Amidohydrolase n=1 Tax=Limobrevibacterium gyesilva TaxID=2991712 RepID=A0AA41YVI7_9PROT|nr:amidohydrolase [Limobrevibacterium gyesilva]MCW3477205.1 amidohydrolase [Limobrevibacterium gyesilva]
MTRAENELPESELADIVAWRRHLHANPETGFNEHRTAAFVAERLAAFGLEVTTGVGGTGVVGTLRNGGGNRAIGLRADMDALLIAENAPDRPHRSRTPGQMHACGHDGHTAGLLGAARALAAARDFDGTIHFIFQPAEEHGRGMQAMLDDGLLQRFPMDEAYGIHNAPGAPVGHFATRAGPIMAAEDNFEITVTGRGVHAARPHAGIDPILAGSAVVMALQQVVSRRIDPVDPAVVSVTEFITDGTRNVIPTKVCIRGDTRSYRPDISAMIEAEIRRIAEATAAAHGATASVTYTREFVPTLNTEGPTEAALRAARAACPTAQDNCAQFMGSEDFARLLAHVPGNFSFIGNGTACAPLHNPAYDFNDAALPVVVAYFRALARDRLPKDAA